MTSAIRLQGVTKRFRDTLAVSNLDLELPAGSLCGFLGPNGAGKSTTIRMIMSIIHPDQGRVEVLGGSALDAKDRIGYLPEERGVYRKMRVGEFLTYIAALKGVAASNARARVAAWLERVQLPGVIQKRCEELSKGMQQKVQFVASVIHGPELLILDEPFSGFDPVNARLMAGLVRQISQEGTTIIFSTHQMVHAEQLCDRVVLINLGEKLLDATVSEIRARFDPRTVVVEPLLVGADGIAGRAAPAQMEAALAAVPGVTEVRWDDVRRAFGVRVEATEAARQVMASAVQMGPVRSMELRRVTLDDVFVQLVGGGPAPSEEGGAADG